MESMDIHATNRLIYFSLAHSTGRRSLVQQHREEIRSLVQKFQSDSEFRETVESGLSAMELQLLDVQDDGLRLSSRNSGSLFASTLSDYGKRIGRDELKAAELLLVHSAVAAALFPTENDLDAPVEDLGVVTPGDVVELLRRFSAAEAVGRPEDADLFPEAVRTAIQRFRELPEENPDRKRLGAGNSWVELIQIVLRHLVDSGYLLSVEDRPGEIEFRPTPSYQASLRQATVAAYHNFRELASRNADEMEV